MPVNKKVLAAVSAAVSAYLQDEEAALPQKSLAEKPVSTYSPWVVAGRAAAMEMRRSWQLRLAR